MELSPQDKIAQLEQIVAADPQDHLGFFLLGKLYLDTKEFGKAAASFEKCLELKPDYSAAWRFAGDAYRLAGMNDKARAVYERGVEVATANRDLQTVKEMQAFLRKLSQ